MVQLIWILLYEIHKTLRGALSGSRVERETILQIYAKWFNAHDTNL